MDKIWIKLENFCAISGFKPEQIHAFIESGTLKSKMEIDGIYLDITGQNFTSKQTTSSEGMLEVEGQDPLHKIPTTPHPKSVESEDLSPILQKELMEKTIATILQLHEKTIASKDETIYAYKSENQLLKDALISLQSLYEEDRQTLNKARKELARIRLQALHN